MKRRVFALALAGALLLSGCAAHTAPEEELHRYEATSSLFLTL